MREIKFRYILEVDNTSKDDPAYYTWLETKIFTLSELEDGNLNEWIIKEFHGVIRTIVRNQYTGLKDKDGKEIYEDDVLGWNNYKYRVYYNQHIAAYGLIAIGIDAACSYPKFKEAEVVGNALENPELVEL